MKPTLSPTPKPTEREGDEAVVDDERNGDLSPTIPVLGFTPKGVRSIPKLHSLVAVKIDAEPLVILSGELEAEGLDSLTIGCKYHKMLLLQV